MSRRGRYPREVRDRAVRMVLEHAGDHESQWVAIVSIAVLTGNAQRSAGNTPSGD
jgi:transposase